MAAPSLRVWVPGARAVGGRAASLRGDLPHDALEPWGVLAEPTRIRGVTIPAGSSIAVDPDADDISIVLARSTRVRGEEVPAGARLRFRGRVVGFPGLRLTLGLAIALPVLWWRRRVEGSRPLIELPDATGPR